MTKIETRFNMIMRCMEVDIQEGDCLDENDTEQKLIKYYDNITDDDLKKLSIKIDGMDKQIKRLSHD